MTSSLEPRNSEFGIWVSFTKTTRSRRPRASTIAFFFSFLSFYFLSKKTEFGRPQPIHDIKISSIPELCNVSPSQHLLSGYYNIMAKHARSGGRTDAKKRRRGPSGGPPSKAKKEIVFDPEARKAYLRGFSERKRQRRAYGLAMQKVKDRKAKLEERKEAKKEDMKRIEEAEQQKAAFLKVTNQDEQEEDVNDEEVDMEDDSSREDKREILDAKTYEDEAWGGQVTVTTTAVDLGDGESSDEEEIALSTAATTKISVDKQQKYAGKVDKFMSQLKGNMPAKKKTKDSTGHHAKRKGKNGAAEGWVGGAANLKLAQKVLSKAQSKQGATKGKARKGGKKSRR